MNNLNKIGILFSCVTCSNKTLSSVFASLAKKWKMSKDSVRNMYYQNFDYVKNNASFCSKYAIDSDKLSKIKGKGFSLDEQSELFNKIEEGKKQGKSVRKVCMELADGDISLMVRYLNKFRTMNQVAENKQNMQFNKSFLNVENIEKSKNKIIQMPIRQDVLTEADIQALFMGLVRLVKNNTVKEMSYTLSQKYKERLLETNVLRNELSVVKGELDEQKRQNKKMQNELAFLKQDRLNAYTNLMQNLNEKGCVKDVN